MGPKAILLMRVTPAATTACLQCVGFEEEGDVGKPQTGGRDSWVEILGKQPPFFSSSVSWKNSQQSSPNCSISASPPACGSTFPSRRAPAHHGNIYHFKAFFRSKAVLTPRAKPCCHKLPSLWLLCLPVGRDSGQVSGSTSEAPRAAISIQHLFSNGPSSCQFDFIIMPTHLLNSLLSFFCTVDLHC